MIMKGFSLIELMIVVAIIAVLAAVALPSYQNYTLKAKFAEVIQAVSPLKLAVESCAREHGSLAGCVEQQGLPQLVDNSSLQQSKVKTVGVSSSGQNSVKITATSQNIGKANAEYSYILEGIEALNGQIFWSKSKISSCIIADLC
ncbi:MAG: prepilin-type N-terminal cleavage/methylation domain-containing protein [Gammaproteobacteria bacterium]|nr:prepilin-type N-terminal cleavage/methylation domain-containing protein [Gammaproteobacteria bacterium]